MKHSRIPLIASILLVLLSSAALLILRDHARTDVFSATMALEFPSFVAPDPGGLVVVDRSLKRVVRMDPDHRLVFAVEGGSREAGRFWFADEAVADERGRVFILNRIMDGPGFHTTASELLEYDARGRFVGARLRRDYTEADRRPSLVQRGNFFGLKAGPRGITFFEADARGLLLHRLDPGVDGVESRRVLSLADADYLISSADVDPQGVLWWLDKQGRVTRWRPDNEPEVVIDVSGTPQDSFPALGDRSFPWRLKADAQGILVTDLGAQRLFRWEDGEVRTVLDRAIAEAQGLSAPDMLCYNLSLGSDGRVGTVNGGGPLVLGPDGNVEPLDSPRYPALRTLAALAWWFFLLVLGVSAIAGLRLFYVQVLHGQLPRFWRMVLAVVSLTALVGGLVSYLILDNFSRRYEAEVINKLEQIVSLVPEYIDVDTLMSIQEPYQYWGPEYQGIRSQVFRAVYGRNLDRNEGYYFALHRLRDDGQLYTFMWLNGEPGIWHPFSYLRDPELAYQATLGGSPSSYSSLDPWGSWMLATAPIYDAQDQVVGVFEMDGDFFAFTEENRKLVQELLINTGTVILILLLALVEAMFLSDLLRKKSQGLELAARGIEARRAEDIYHRTYLARPLTGIFFAATSLSLLFLPLMMKELAVTTSHPALEGLNPEVVWALPLSARLLFFGLGTVLGGSLVSRTGWRGIFGAGVVLSALGLTGAALVSDLLLFIAASAVLGWGTGLATVALRSLVNHEPDDEVRSTGFTHFYSGLIAGTNLGVVSGSWLADFVGYRNVFWTSVVLVMVVVFAALILLPRREDPPAPPLAPTRIPGETRTLLAFAMNPRILAFFALVVIPVYAISMVLGYVFPVFASTEGLNNADMGRLFLLNGLVIIYLGPPLAAMAKRRLGVRAALVLSSLVWAASLLPFVLWGSLESMILTLVLMGLAEGLAVSAQNDFYFSLPAVARIGSDRAVGIFEVAGKVGETLAPILLSLALILGPQAGMLLVMGMGLGLLLLFIITGGLSRKGKNP